jgi:hypothetical protein
MLENSPAARATDASRVPAKRSADARREAPQRSRVTNGSALFVEGDDRSAWARRYRDLIFAHTSDLGGAAAVSEAQVALIKRAATLQIELELLEGKLSLAPARAGQSLQGKRQPPESLRVIAENCLAMAARYQPGSEAKPNPEADEGKYGYWLTAAREALKAASSHESVNLDVYGRTVGHLRRVLEALGLERKCRDVTMLDGVEVEEVPWSPMRARWAADEAAAAAKRKATTE